MPLKVKTVLNAIQHFPGFVFDDLRLLEERNGQPRLEVASVPHAGRPARGSHCRQAAPGYDHLPARAWLFVPRWGLVTHFIYPARRVHCPAPGVVVEFIPGSTGQRPVTIAMMCFLSRWARRRSWRETAQVLGTSWECVYRSVEWFVAWGLAHRKLENVHSIGGDEIHWGRSKGADSFLTVIYQIDGHCRRRLWVGQRRTQATLRWGLATLGDEVVGGLRFVCRDRWRPYLNVIAEKAGQALPGLDRFHLTLHLNQAGDQVRRAERVRLRASASGQADRLKNMRWKLRRCGSRVRGKARRQLNDLTASKLATARAWILKETFQPFGRYRSTTWAGYFLSVWTERALRRRLEPMKKVARRLRSHEDRRLNWFKAKGEISRGAVEGLNNKIRVVTRRSYGFRTDKAMKIALDHNLGRLPEPNEFTHRFC